MLKKIAHKVGGRIVPKWYRKWSVQLSGLFASACIVLPSVVSQYKDMLPPRWMGLTFLAILVAAVFTQKNMGQK